MLFTFNTIVSPQLSYVHHASSRGIMTVGLWIMNIDKHFSDAQLNKGV